MAATNGGSSAIHFGVMLPQFGVTWSQAREVAQAADEAGLDSVWAVDHFVGFPVDTEPLFEGWTQMTAIAALTRRVRVGHLVLCVSYRSPALLAKMAATLDTISEGRLILGLGAGWHGIEYAQYGYEFPPIAARLQQLGETLEILRRMWTDERATFEGHHFAVRDAVLLPKPVQRRLPILIGGGGEKVLLRHVARHADVWNNMGSYHADVAHKIGVLEEHCRSVGRNARDILVTQQTLAAIAMDRTDAARRSATVLSELAFLDASPDLALTGTPDEIRSRVEKNRALGVGGFVMNFGRRTDPEHVRLFGREVAAAYR
jgi:F420-dependent oxidoreductase-like protein